MELYFNKLEDPQQVEDFPEDARMFGDLATTKRDGFSDSAGWIGSAYSDTNKMIFVKCPEIGESEAQNMTRPWWDDFEYEVIQNQPNLGRYLIEVREKVPGAAGQHNLTREKIESFLTRWNCYNLTFNNNSCRFVFDLDTAIRSVGFWQAVKVLSNSQISVLSYNGQTGFGDVEVRILNSPMVTADDVLPWIADRGGEILTAEHPVYTFRIHRAILRDRFKMDVRLAAQKPYRSRRYYVSSDTMAWIEAQGNGVTVTRAQLLANLLDKAG